MPRRDDSLAVILGFSSAGQLHQSPRHPRTLVDFARIPAEARAIRSDAAVAVSTARRRRIGLQLAALEVGVPLVAIEWWFPDAVIERDGEQHATAADSEARLRPIAVEGEVTFVPVNGSDEADRVAAWFAVQWEFITGRIPPEALATLPDVRVAGRRLERDPHVLEALALAGEFDLDDIYRELIG